ncbi:MAG: radical SAM family heme chaperone HemW [Deltaproteobacteria bacterium]|nr:radical SAM family heme chaperone HemW [Deltaproteobacteria bacterium]
MKEPRETGVVDQARPLGVYVHFPFCRSRCPYCDFAVAVPRDIPHEAYADAVLAELAARAPDYLGKNGPRLASVYFGGGTPGLWRPAALGRVLEGVRQRFRGGPDLEVTVEANPGDLPLATLLDLRRRGANRLSFGAQAFQDRLLRRLGRRHGSAAIAASLAAARRAGFANLCADLMFGLPGQSMPDWRASLAALSDLRPEHITAYALTVEAGTRFGALERAGRLRRPGDGEVADMYATCHETLIAAGYEHYEISSYSLPGRRSTHNSLYWTMGTYLGLGVSAASFLPLAAGGGFRRANPRSLATYLRQVAVGADDPAPELAEYRSTTQLEEEALWLGLRTADGVDRAAHAESYGHDPLALPGREAAARVCADAGWLDITPTRLRLRPAGFLFADEVTVRLWRGAGTDAPQRAQRTERSQRTK